MIPKEVTKALGILNTMACTVGDCSEHTLILDKFLKTTDRYVKDLEQHVDDLVVRGDCD